MSLDVTSCASETESSATLSAQSGSAELDVNVEGGQGSAVFSSDTESWDGTVTSLEVGDAGNVTASGSFTAPGNSSATFTLTGSC